MGFGFDQALCFCVKEQNCFCGYSSNLLILQKLFHSQKLIVKNNEKIRTDFLILKIMPK